MPTLTLALDFPVIPVIPVNPLPAHTALPTLGSSDAFGMVACGVNRLVPHARTCLPRALWLLQIHTTEYDWPKCEPPAPFAMKCRKHIRTRRLTGLSQVGTDRVICLTFGANETTYHLIVELYDKGNILLCDHQYVH
jgi:hypothetical protein